MPFNVVLVAPEIPQNTGNIIRLCANTGARLHLIEPLGFELSKKSLRRAYLDYRDLANVEVQASFELMFDSIDQERVFATTVDGATMYDQVEYRDGDTVVFGSESRGLSPDVIFKVPSKNHISIPMMPANRSINLSNAVALVVYEMWRQQSFAGAKTQHPDSRLYFS
jgi:tRNA (cytidine/uridine-2'-O-)-methyltransferase